MFRLPPRSAFFPYSTLFRSCGKKVIFDSHEDVPQQIHSKTWIKSSVVRRTISGVYSLVEKCSVLFCNTVIADRKSTRLNSSHLGISYAVFCLKNKNKDRKLV